MKLFASFKRKRLEARYKRDDLRIIENVSADNFQTILTQYQDEGWELTDTYTIFQPELKTWQGKLRKGTSVLTCDWHHEYNGSISGLARIIEGLAPAYQLTVLSYPTYRS